MEDEILTQTPPPEETIVPVTPIAPATDAPTAPPAATAPENSALVNAFERTKAQLKEIEAQNKKYKGLLEQLQANLGGNTGASSNAVELLNSFSVQEKLEAMRKDAAAQAEAKVRGETQQAIAAAKQEAEMARSSLASVRRRQSVFDFFTANGGIATEFDSFYALAGEQIDVDLSTPVAKVVKVKSSDGIQLYDDDQRPIDPAGFMVAVRSGKMGSKALQSTLIPYNQSSGVGTSPAGRTPDGKPVLDRSRIQEYVDLWHKQGLDPTKKIKEAEWR